MALRNPTQEEYDEIARLITGHRNESLRKKKIYEYCIERGIKTNITSDEIEKDAKSDCLQMGQINRGRN